MKPLLFEKGDESILSGLMVMINDRVVTGTSLNQADVRLRGGDRVSLMYFVSGG
jgi:sulfur carrier protein ThiS